MLQAYAPVAYLGCRNGARQTPRGRMQRRSKKENELPRQLRASVLHFHKQFKLFTELKANEVDCIWSVT